MLNQLTDPLLIQAILARDNAITEEFFFVKCRPLFLKIIRTVFSYPVDYDEFVNELYQYLLKDDGYKLKQFDHRSTFMQWLKVVAIRYFIQKRDKVIEDASKEPPYTEGSDKSAFSEGRLAARMDLERLFELMPNKRYVYVLQKLMLEDSPPELLAESMGVTTANLYNIKKRAMAALTHVALKDIRNYGKK